MSGIIDDVGSVFVDNKMMRKGYTTGTCAAAASKAAATMLLSYKIDDFVTIHTPRGMVLELQVLDPKLENRIASCAIQKDGGDDADETSGILIYSEVTLIGSKRITIEGGEGVGSVTRKGLDQPVGNPAINRVPRQMIIEALDDVSRLYGYIGGFKVKIYVPEGRKVAMKTFNPRLGIEGGISILGTTGIVEPMSEKALVDTIRVEMNMNVASGKEYLFVVPGNYGVDFAKKNPNICSMEPIKCSNFIGDTLDMACEMGIKGMLLVGNLGKFVKIAGGIMNTHSKYADCRMEILASNAILAGADTETAKKIMSCMSTDEALGILYETKVAERTMELITEKIQFHLSHRVHNDLVVGAVIYSTEYGILGETETVPFLINEMNKESSE